MKPGCQKIQVPGIDGVLIRRHSLLPGNSVIPAQAGIFLITKDRGFQKKIPAFAGMTGFI
jgi:hypothetical protein